MSTIITTNLYANDPATISGTITSDRGELISGANILIENTTIGAVADYQGRYQIEDLPEGDYAIIVSSIGYSTARKEVSVESGEVVNLDFILPEAALSLDNVVVTATRMEIELLDVPASVSLVSARDIERRGAIYPGEELSGIPGVKPSMHSEGTYTSIVIRGVPNEHHNDTFLALVDGVPYVTNSDEVDLERMMPLSLMERVEVVRGPTSALYGRGSVSGVVNYITKPALSAYIADASIRYGMYNYFRPQLTLSLPFAENQSSLLVDGFYEIKDGWRDRSDRRAGNLFVKNEWNLGASTNATFYFNYNDNNQKYASPIPIRDDGSFISMPGGRSANYQIDDTYDARRVIAGTAILDHRFSENISLQTKLQYRNNYFDTNLGFFVDIDEEHTSFHWNGYDAVSDYSTFFAEPQINIEMDRFRILAGANYERLDGFSTADWTGQYGFVPGEGFLFYIQKRNYVTGEMTNRDDFVTDRRTDAGYVADVYGTFLQAEIDLTQKAVLTLGGRFDWFSREVDYRTLAPQGSEIPGEIISDNDGHFSPKVGLSYRWTPSFSTYATFGEGFSPAFGSISVFRDREGDLKPEIAYNYEVGSKGEFFDSRLFLGAAVYLLERRDLLVVSYGEGEQRTFARNAGSQSSRGLELEMKANLSDWVNGLGINGSYTYTDARFDEFNFVDEFTDEEFDFSGKKVTGVSPHMATLGIYQQFGDEVSAGVRLEYTGRYWADHQNTFRADPVMLVNANMSYRPKWAGGAELLLNALNLTNRNYYSYYATNERVISGYPTRPFELIATLRFRY
ncbi:MAG: TonB-dependent receptor [Balneolaceae bacterium]